MDLVTFGNTSDGLRRAAHCCGACLCVCGCLETMPFQEAIPEPSARLILEVALPAAETPAACIQYLTVQLVSSRRDSLRDTITREGSRLSFERAALEPAPRGAQSVTPWYHLPAGRVWSIRVEARDANDTLRFADSFRVDGLRPEEYRKVTFAPAPRFVPWSACFQLPGSREAPDGTARVLFFSRLKLEMDGSVVCDTVAPRYFRTASAKGVVLTHEYVRPGERRFVLSAYGRAEGDSRDEGAERLLFQGTRTLTVASGVPSATGTVVLEWKGEWEEEALPGSAPAGNGARLLVTLGPVGHGVLEARIPEAIDF